MRHTPIARIVEHFVYLAERIGVDHVGFGADLDGALIPDEVGDVSGLPRVSPPCAPPASTSPRYAN